ncbi:EamA family transporter [Rhodomicrobium sp.]|uniref:aromatic amino acid exporter YddG n=1 Tax=Rhodomicrobium sp. TaxID=2720632 RepID=UPI0039E61F86
MHITSGGKATAIGLLAIPLWALLPTLTVLAGAIPPLELVALTFTIGSLAGFVWLAANASARRGLGSLGWKPVALGVAAFFVDHFAFFLAMQNAPAVEASLVNYLWPVLIVMFSTMLPARASAGKLTVWHISGVSMAFAGAALAITGGAALSLGGNAFGYAMAATAALTWSSYSVLTRLFRGVPSAAVSIYCLGTAVLAWGAHLALEDFVMPAPGTQLFAILALGAGPIGLAFYVWDYGCKHGDLRTLGVLAYFSPLLSTALLTVTGLGPSKPALWVAALLITGGAILASRDALRTMRGMRRAPASAPALD